MTIRDDRAADRRMVVSIGLLMLVEVVLAALADAGTIGLVAWMALAVVAVLGVAAFGAWWQRRPTS